MGNLDEHTPQLGAEIRAVVERQLQQPDLAAVNQTLDRLMEQGHEREQAIDAIGAVLLEEMQEMMEAQEAFDRDRYVERLRGL